MSDFENEEIELVSVDVSRLKAVQDLKSVTTDKDEVADIAVAGEYLPNRKFFKHLKKYFHKFFKKHKNIKTLYVTNEKKGQPSSRNLYYLEIRNEDMHYEEETQKQLVVFKYNFRKDILRSSKGEIKNDNIKEKFFNRIKSIGEDIKGQKAYVFERE